MAADEELPQAPWFKLRYYGPCGNWSALDWFRAISNRLALRISIDRDVLPDQAADAHFAAISRDPREPSGLRWATPGRTSSLMMSIAEARGERLELMSPVVETSIDMASSYWALHWGKDFRLLAVDLAAPDSAVQVAFALLLKQMRESQQPVGRVSDADLRAWSSSHALAYIDMGLYFDAYGVSFTQAQIADALFPNAEVDRVERLRKVTMKHARRMISLDMHTRLAGQLGERALKTPAATDDGSAERF